MSLFVSEQKHIKEVKLFTELNICLAGGVHAKLAVAANGASSVL